jgi:hypothetical protein
MKNSIIKTITIALLIVGISACSDDYFDVNTPSTAVDLDELGMKDLFAPVLHSTIFAQYYAEQSFGNYTQYFGSYGSGAAGEAELGATWNEVYLYILPNLQAIKVKADAQNAKHYGAVADIVKAINIGFATDSWDKIPYSEATQALDNSYPSFDTQESIYTEVFALLNSAINALEAPDPSQINIGSEDLIYGGDKGKWLRAAYTMKARFQLRMVAKGLATPNDVLTSIANGFTSNSDDFQMSFPPEQLNPWYSTEILSRNTGNFYRAPNDQLISMMNGTTYPFESDALEIDPRLPAIYANEGEAGDPWRGFMNGGTGESSDGEPANTFYKDGGFYTSATAPIVLITYAEAMFIKAEAAFLANGGSTTSTGATSDAYAAYMDGIAANMSKIGVSGADYMADPAVAVEADGLMLNHIMKEKYIANILNPETFSDFRRYNFSADVFKGLALRLEDEELEFDYKGMWFRRAVYPTSERNTNPDVVQENYQEPIVSVWWAE